MDDAAPTSQTPAAPEVAAPDTQPSQPSQAFAPNPMAIEFVDLTDNSHQPDPVQPVDAFDTARHAGLLDRLEHELALVDAALTHIDDDDLDAADTAIKELVRHNDDGQVALPLR